MAILATESLEETQVSDGVRETVAASLAPQDAPAGGVLAPGGGNAAPLSADTPRLRHASIETRVAVAFLASFLLLLLGGGITYKSLNDSADAARSMARTQRVLSALGGIQSGTIDMESAAFTLTLSGSPRYLQDFRSAARARVESLRVLAALLSNDARERQDVARFDVLAEQHRQLMEQVVEASTREGFSAASAIVRSDAMRASMDELRNRLRAMSASYGRHLVELEARARTNQQESLLALGLTMVAVCAIFVYLLSFIRHEMLARARAERRTLELNAELQHRVTERTRAMEKSNEAVRLASDFYRATLDNMLEGCQIIDYHWRYRFVNATAARQMRRTPGEMIGRTMQEVFTRADTEGYVGVVRECMEDRQARRAEAHLADREGQVHWFEISVFPGRDELSIFSIDVTERKQSEVEIRAINAELERRVEERTTELVQARDAADAASRAKSAFLATMSHEIRTPMNGVIGMAEVLTRGKLDEHEADAVRTIRGSAFTLLALIDDILDFSKIEAGKLEIESVPMSMLDLVETTCATLMPVADDKQVDMDFFVDPRLPARLMSDPTRMRQILFNLVGNAIKFSSGRAERGHVTVRAELDQRTPPYLLLRVRDNGIGIDPSVLSNLFSSFTQAEASTTRRFGGSGLGLAICKRLVELMGGDISVDSAVGMGSTFMAALPLVKAPALPEVGALDLRGVECLLLADTPRASDLAMYLEHAGARVRTAGSLAEAARLAAGVEGGLVVVIQPPSEQGEPGEAVRQHFSALPQARHLLVGRGLRLATRGADRDRVMLDSHGLRRWALLRAVAVAAGRASPETGADAIAPEVEVEAAAAPTIAQARAAGQLILVAEDDEVNQKVILRQLEMMGLVAEIAGNGADALRLWREGNYALLLSDLHMPQMDGYALTEAIRTEEIARGVSPESRMPILALTANALRGEERRAHAAGMDEYLTKPLQLSPLKAAIFRWLKRAAPETRPPPEAETVTAPRAADALVDVSVLKGMVGDDEEIVREFLSDYRKSSDRLAGELMDAHRAGDPRKVMSIAHQLKSSSRAVGALTLGDLCAEVENVCKAGSTDGVEVQVQAFVACQRAVRMELDRLLSLSEPGADAKMEGRITP